MFGKMCMLNVDTYSRILNWIGVRALIVPQLRRNMILRSKPDEIS